MTKIDALAQASRVEPAAVITDYDGTLAPIVEDPSAALPLTAASEALHALVGRFALVAVVSGRPVDFLRAHLASDGRNLDGLTIVGQYGLERLVGDRIAVDPRALPYADAVARAADDATATWPALTIERKGSIAVTIHWRTHADLAPRPAELDALAASHGLTAHPGRQSCELRTPVPVDKGTTIDTLLEERGCNHAAFLGDDAGDLAAFDALDRLDRRRSATGTTSVTARVAVRSAEVPPALLERADLVVDGPAGVAETLSALARP